MISKCEKTTCGVSVDGKGRFRTPQVTEFTENENYMARFWVQLWTFCVVTWLRTVFDIVTLCSALLVYCWWLT